MEKKSIFGNEIFEYTGAIHIHSKYSWDSKVELSKIVKDAKNCQLDFTTINDHHTCEAKVEISEQKYDGLYIVVGYEMNDAQRNNHYLIFNFDEILPTSLSAEEYVKKVSAGNGIGFIAHPIEKRRCKRLRDYQWENWNITEFDGIEIWNFLSEWTDSLSIPFNYFAKIISPNSSIKGPYKDTLKTWDNFNLKGFRKSAIGSTDAHGRSFFTPLANKKLFKTIRTNIFLREKLSEKNSDQQILSALKNGSSYIANYHRGNPENFSCYIYSKQSKNFALLGEEIKLSEKELFLSVNLPQKNMIKIIFNGEIILSEISDTISIPISKSGFYRIEVYKGKFGWIYSNPIYVK